MKHPENSSQPTKFPYSSDEARSIDPDDETYSDTFEAQSLALKQIADNIAAKYERKSKKDLDDVHGSAFVFERHLLNRINTLETEIQDLELETNHNSTSHPKEGKIIPFKRK